MPGSKTKGLGPGDIRQAMFDIPRPWFLVNWLNITPQKFDNKLSQFIYTDASPRPNIKYAVSITFCGQDISSDYILDKSKVSSLLTISSRQKHIKRPRDIYTMGSLGILYATGNTSDSCLVENVVDILRKFLEQVKVGNTTLNEPYVVSL